MLVGREVPFFFFQSLRLKLSAFVHLSVHIYVHLNIGSLICPFVRRSRSLSLLFALR